MKKSTVTQWLIFLLIASMSILMACKASQKSVVTGEPTDISDALASQKNPAKQSRNVGNAANAELVDMLRTISGIYIRGGGPNYDIQVRGKTSISGDNRPLYVIDGVPVGRDYAGAAGSVDVRNISSVRLLSGPQASIYGNRGANGVIVIKTKKK